MIKCFGFGKLLKQSFIISLIGFFGLLVGSFASALTVEKIGVNMSSPISNNNTLFSVLPYGSFMGSYLGLGKPIIPFANRSLNTDNTKGQYIFFMWISGKPYLYYSYTANSSSSMTTFQGFINKYKLCDELTESSTSISNCSDSDYFGAVVNDFLSTVKSTDYYGVNFSSGRPSLCISSSQYSKSLCFWDLSSSKLTGSVNIPALTSFENLDVNYDSQSPAVPINNGFQGGGGTSVNFGGTLSGNYLYKKCTYGAVQDYLESLGANKYLCYGGLDNFDLYDPDTNYNIVPGTGKKLSEILSYSSAWDSPQERFDFWNGLYGSYNSMWSSYPAVYKTWFDIYYRYNNGLLYFDYLREYCVMTVDLDIDRDTIYNGKYLEKFCSQIQDKGLGLFDSSGNVVVGLNWSGVGNLSGNNINSPAGYIQDFFNVILANFPTKYDLGLGFLPSYIITFLLALILFRFLSH